MTPASAGSPRSTRSKSPFPADLAAAKAFLGADLLSLTQTVASTFIEIGQSAFSVLEDKSSDAVEKLITDMEADLTNIEQTHFLLRHVSEPQKLKELLGVGATTVKKIDRMLHLFGLVAKYQQAAQEKAISDKSAQPSFPIITSCHNFITNMALELYSNHCELIMIELKTRKNQKDESKTAAA